MGRVSGPHTDTPLLNLRIPPLGVEPKNASGEFWLIHHSLSPVASVNDAINPAICRMKYASFDAAVGMIKMLGSSVTISWPSGFAQFPLRTLTC